ncbi:DUF4747 family protein [Salinicoccus roseus]|uniref:DUF4747 family protein n=1 Tax=Salinicoccus roseus TaxID=45670 RepID=UPI001584D710|nr:DUF4747 family protein [Salinicoccus roseus]
MAKIYQAKMNVNEKIFEVYSKKIRLDDLLDELYGKINSNVIVEEPRFEIKYKFINVNRDSKRHIVNGVLIRIHKEKQIDIYEEDEDDISEERIKRFSEKVPFSFDVQREVVSFVPSNTFRKERFIDVFRQLLEEAYPKMGTINITLLTDQEAFERKYNRIKRLGKFSAVIVPPNGADDLFDDVDELINDLIDSNATEFKQELSTNVRNPLNKESRIIKGLKKLAKSGYGYITAYGKDENNNRVDINTKTDKNMHKTYIIDEKLRNSPIEIMSVVEEKEK